MVDEWHDYLDQTASSGLTSVGGRVVHVALVLAAPAGQTLTSMFHLTQGRVGLFVDAAAETAVNALVPAPKGLDFMSL